MPTKQTGRRRDVQRTNAKNRALRRLWKLHPETFRKLYLEELRSAGVPHRELDEESQEWYTE